ncbi:pirin family protein [Mitsuaria sp. WAJ17]|uniref:pirin family protein n=1 Tax=Mitsuaria sp. WAJ17 TaxID=2761452 RepID=UPI001600EADF|nr:pirin family protein [Mitsuaria sp. WAJ17]MBB2486321.1 pirin family protein [Mitsuaria sp. WAJ17]
MPAARIIQGHEKDLGGGFKVSRLLPDVTQRSVGPFIFMDHFGPATSHGDPAHDVRPHPHIGLSTVSYLFEGALLHHDSTGAQQEIRPGDINWMTAGKGVVHSERAPAHLRGASYAMHGLQLWCALPQEEEECEPAFQHVAAADLPVLERPGARIRVLVGQLGGLRSPVHASASTLYLHLSLAPGATLALSDWDLELPEEWAIYAPSQDLLLGGEPLPARQLVVLRSAAGSSPADATPAEAANQASAPQPPSAFELSAPPWAPEPTELVLLGGKRLDGHRHLWWNFVSSRKERIEQAARDWAEGRFPKVPGEDDFIPLPPTRP